MDVTQRKRSKIIFVDQINFRSLLKMLILVDSSDLIWYFDPINPFVHRLLTLFRKLGLFRATVKQINYNIGQVKSNTGQMKYRVLVGDARTICTRIKRDHLLNNPLIRKMEPLWATRKILFHFEKLAERQVELECLRISLVEWMLQSRIDVASTQCILLIKRKQWFRYLEEYAQLRGIRLICYGHSLGWVGITARVSLHFTIVCRKILSSLLKLVKGWLNFPYALVHSGNMPGKSTEGKKPKSSVIAIRSWYKNFSFDPIVRSDLFWIKETGIPYHSILLYGYDTDKPLDPEIIKQIKSCGMQVYGRGPGISSWSPSKKIISVFLQTLGKISSSLLSCFVHGEWVSPYYLSNLLILAIRYAYWYDFYSANRITINVGTLNTNVAQVLALDSLNGVSISYQYTAAIFSPSTFISVGENVQFVFSRTFEQLWRSIEAPVDNFVHTGFIFDHSLITSYKSNRTTEVRKQLQNNGAQFVICFFDENSSDLWNHYASHEDSADNYEYLLKWLLAVPTLGLVFKPKVSSKLFRRIARVSDLIHQAKQTGRCVFLTSDTFYGSIFPAEAALMADVCIGSAVGTTAALEARLAGIPTVLIDSNGVQNPFFDVTEFGRVVFRDWDSLRAAVEQYRSLPDSQAEFGDWSSVLNNFDPFHDSQGCMRMGNYICWLYDALNKGISKQAALEMATERFGQQWGNEHITLRLNGK